MIALIHIKKTAGKTVKHLMRCEYGARHCDVKRWHPDDACLDAAGLRRILRVMPQCRSIAGHSIRAYSDLRAYLPNIALYTFLRAPVKRCISQYQYEVTQGRIPPDSFDQWIEREDVQDLQVKSLAGCADIGAAIDIVANEPVFVGLTEAFEASLAMMPSLLGTPVIRPQRTAVNAAGDNRIRNRLLADDKALARIRAANAGDLALYDYIERHVFPRERRAATRTTLACRPRRFPITSGFIANIGVRYGIYKPAVAVWQTCQKSPMAKPRLPVRLPY